MNQATIARYQPGGDIYQRLANTYGSTAANAIAQAAASGDNTQLVNAIEQARGNGAAQNPSTTDAFINQLMTDPLSAPLSSANNLVGNSITAFLQNPKVLLVIGIILFLSLGGANVVKKWISKL